MCFFGQVLLFSGLFDVSVVEVGMIKYLISLVDL